MYSHLDFHYIPHTNATPAGPQHESPNSLPLMASNRHDGTLTRR